jgi:hypothetical protein
MSKSKETGEQVPAEFDNPETQAQSGTPEGNDIPAEQVPAENAEGNPAEPVPPENNGEPVLRSIEEHAEKLKVGKPVFAALIQSESWAAGKKVTEAAFKAAINAFLNAPTGGKEGEEKPSEGDKS